MKERAWLFIIILVPLLYCVGFYLTSWLSTIPPAPITITAGSAPEGAVITPTFDLSSTLAISDFSWRYYFAGCPTIVLHVPDGCHFICEPLPEEGKRALLCQCQAGEGE